MAGETTAMTAMTVLIGMKMNSKLSVTGEVSINPVPMLEGTRCE